MYTTILKHQIKQAIIFIASWLFVLHDRYEDCLKFIYGLYLKLVVRYLIRKPIPIIIHASYGKHNITHAMNYYYDHDIILSCASLYRWLSKFKHLNVDSYPSRVLMVYYDDKREKIKLSCIDINAEVCYINDNSSNPVSLEAGDIDLSRLPYNQYSC